MTVKQLKEILKDKPDHMDVFMGENTSDFHYSLVASVYVKTIPFSEDPGGKAMAEDEVLVIEDI